MKDLGKVICILGNFFAILFPPVKFMGFSGGWQFLFGDAGMGFNNYQFIDSGLLLVELLVINGIGITLYFIGKKNEKEFQEKNNTSVTPESTT